MPSWGNDRRNRSNRIGWPITARNCLQMVLCYSSSSYAGVFAIFYVHNSQQHAWNPFIFFPTLDLSFIFFSSNFNITCHIHHLAHFYPENPGSIFFLNSGTHPPDYLSQSTYIKPPHESSLLRNSKSHKIIIPVCFNGTHQLQMNRILIYTVLLSIVL